MGRTDLFPTGCVSSPKLPELSEHSVLISSAVWGELTSQDHCGNSASEGTCQVTGS